MCIKINTYFSLFLSHINKLNKMSMQTRAFQNAVYNFLNAGSTFQGCAGGTVFVLCMITAV